MYASGANPLLSLLLRYSEERKEGWLSSNLAPLYAFLHSKTFASKEQIQRWKENLGATLSNAENGLKKQLTIQSQYFLDPDSPCGEGE